MTLFDVEDEVQLNEPIQEIELLIRASSIDGKRKGASIFCQEYFMDLYLLAELKTISLKITTVDMNKPPVDFRDNFQAAVPPILIHNGISVLENEKIERYIMKKIPGGHNLFVADKEIAKLIEDLYSRFNQLFSRNYDYGSRRAVLVILEGINSELTARQYRFLTGNTICCFDCELMPKLQHIIVAGKHFFNFHIPYELVALWRYIKEMYSLDAFIQSCPADQDINHSYRQKYHKLEMMNGRQNNREELETPTYTMEVPSGLFEAVNI